MSRPLRSILARAAGTVAAATVMAVLLVLPAEYGIDPTGFGRWSGLLRPVASVEPSAGLPAGIPPEAARDSERPFRTDTVRLEIRPTRGGFAETEFKLSVRGGDTILYAWTASAELYYEFHGHAEAPDDEGRIAVVTYRSDSATQSFGTLVAPMDGLHGWFFQSVEPSPVRIELRLAGHYRLETDP